MSDIDTEVVDSLNVLDPERPIREADFSTIAQLIAFQTSPSEWAGAEPGRTR